MTEFQFDRQTWIVNTIIIGYPPITVNPKNGIFPQIQYLQILIFVIYGHLRSCGLLVGWFHQQKM